MVIPTTLPPNLDLARLDDLIAEARQTDLIVDLTIKGEARRLSPTLELSAYRVIQEALTNTRKHSGATRASVRLQYGLTDLEVEVLDDGPNASSGRWWPSWPRVDRDA